MYLVCVLFYICVCLCVVLYLCPVCGWFEFCLDCLIHFCVYHLFKMIGCYNGFTVDIYVKLTCQWYLCVHNVYSVSFFYDDLW